MGPPTLVDGDPEVYSMRACVIWMLQWGRRLSPTETSRELWPINLRTELQWGRRLSSTETRAHYSFGPRLYRFNGAADSRRRRHSCYAGRLARRPVLQWGRRLSSTETLASAFTVTPQIKLQWGRRLRRRRRSRQCCCRSCVVASM